MSRKLKTINRAKIRGKRLNPECYKAKISKFEWGSDDNRCFCYGLFDAWGCDLWEECKKCKAHVDNALPLSENHPNVNINAGVIIK